VLKISITRICRILRRKKPRNCKWMAMKIKLDNKPLTEKLVQALTVHDFMKSKIIVIPGVN